MGCVGGEDNLGLYHFVICKYGSKKVWGIYKPYFGRLSEMRSYNRDVP